MKFINWIMIDKANKKCNLKMSRILHSWEFYGNYPYFPNLSDFIILPILSSLCLPQCQLPHPLCFPLEPGSSQIQINGSVSTLVHAYNPSTWKAEAEES